MCDENEEENVCEAFNQLFNTIKYLQKIENSAKHLNVNALEKCKNEIEDLLHFSFEESRGKQSIFTW